LFWKTDIKRHVGRLFGIMLVGIFFSRFVLEFVKENQVAFESRLPLNLGQLLSIPLVAMGVYLIFSAKLSEKPRTLPKPRSSRKALK